MNNNAPIKLWNNPESNKDRDSSSVLNQDYVDACDEVFDSPDNTSNDIETDKERDSFSVLIQDHGLPQNHESNVTINVCKENNQNKERGVISVFDWFSWCFKKPWNKGHD